MKNKEIGVIFREIAQILQIKGENVFRIRAYERAAQNIENLPQDIEDLARQDTLTEIPGIGKDLSERIKEYFSTGRIIFFEELKSSVPEGVLELLRIPSIGPKTAKLLFEQLGIQGVADLENAISSGKLNGIEGIKEKTIENMLRGIALVKKGSERMTLAEAIVVAEGVTAGLKDLPDVDMVACAGSLRRQKDTVRDIDILVVSASPGKVMDAFIALPQAADVQAHGDTKSSFRTAEGVQVDCRVVDKKSFGAALVYFTGSKDFNIKIRQVAMKEGLKVNEYGVYRGDDFVAGSTEEDVFRSLGLAYIAPELREDSGEVEAARDGQLPRLVELKDIRGDLHVHSTWSDGRDGILDMVKGAASRGYSYVAITDHSQSLKIARGLDRKALLAKKKEIDAINKTLKGIRVLFGTEADIGSDGTMDYPDDVLAEFDVVVAALHTGFHQSREQITRRMIKACQNKYVHIIAHPTGRLWGQRDAYEVDLEEVFKVAQDTRTCFEINSYPKRLDLNDAHCRRAKELGITIAINTDSHAAEQLVTMRLGVAVARRGWLEKENILNSLPIGALLKRLKK